MLKVITRSSLIYTGQSMGDTRPRVRSTSRCMWSKLRHVVSIFSAISIPLWQESHSFVTRVRTLEKGSFNAFLAFFSKQTKILYCKKVISHSCNWTLISKSLKAIKALSENSQASHLLFFFFFFFLKKRKVKFKTF